jgi:hypothetical protein
LHKILIMSHVRYNRYTILDWRLCTKHFGAKDRSFLYLWRLCYIVINIFARRIKWSIATIIGVTKRDANGATERVECYMIAILKHM